MRFLGADAPATPETVENGVDVLREDKAWSVRQLLHPHGHVNGNGETGYSDGVYSPEVLQAVRDHLKAVDVPGDEGWYDVPEVECVVDFIDPGPGGDAPSIPDSAAEQLQAVLYEAESDVYTESHGSKPVRPDSEVR